MVAIRKSKPGSRGPPKGAKVRAAGIGDVVADSAHQAHEIVYEASPGDWVKAVIVARELTWSERSAIGEKNTQTRQIGRDTISQLDATGAARDMLLAALNLNECKPALTRDDITRLKGPLFDAIMEALNFGHSAEEDEKAAGESAAP